MEMKGFLPFTLAALGIIFTFTMILMVALVFIALRYHVDINLKFEYDKSFSDLTMLSLLRLNYNSTYSSYRVLSEREVNGFDQGMKDFLSREVGLLADTDCFRIGATSSILQVCSSGEPYEYAGEAFIFKPYNPDKLVEEITLTYNKVKR